MTSQLIHQQSIEYNFRFQKGMYFDGEKKISGANILFSNHIKDFYWNYAIDINVTESFVPTIIENIEMTMSTMNRQPAIYITPLTQPLELLKENLLSRGYQRQFQDAWMFFKSSSEVVPTRENEQIITIKQVDNSSETEDFVNVFNSVYAGEPSEDEPYANLPPTYLAALHQSFSTRNVKTFHLVGYKTDQPITIATLVYENGWGGIYNVGTLTAYRHQGIGALISHACINKWKELKGHTLFLQTEVGSKNEQFYSNLGFKTAFIGECWSK